MFTEITSGIAVHAKPRFLPEESHDGRFVWSYTIEIENKSADTVQLLTRHWRITDANGLTQEVHGPGVVGEQPVIKPGDSYKYTSACPLSTSSGIMVGSYQMVRLDDQSPFDIAVPAFSLDSPHDARLAN